MSTEEAWQQGLEQRELMLRVCARCSRAAFPPMPGCPHCGHDEGELVTASGDGTLYSWTVCHHAFDAQFAAETPYVVGIVALVEGARVVARVEAPADELRADMWLRARFPRTGKGPPRLTFVPLRSGDQP